MKYLAVLSLIVILYSCGNNEKSNSNEVELLKKENLLLKKEMEIDSLKQKISSEKTSNENIETENINKKQVENTNIENIIRIGRHSITLQWLSFDNNPSGSVAISKISENKYKIEGGQKNNNNSDYLTINGTLTPMNKNELIFEGTLIYKVEHNNSGLPCDKSGRHLFKSTQNRKYWRMQEMQNCEGGMLTDYVDIFF